MKLELAKRPHGREVYSEEDRKARKREEALLVEAARLRKEIVASAEKLHQVCSTLYTESRRNASDFTSHYVSISNAGRRFAGAVLQGARRTESVDRILLAAKKTALEDKEREEEAKRRVTLAEERKRKSAAITRDVYGIFESSNEDAPIDRLLSAGNAAADLNDLYGDE